MATPINRIKIQEKDLTSAGFSAAATDIVYVPGFSALDDQIVFSEPGVSPFDKFEESIDTTKIFINAADEISWKYNADARAWVETDTYVEPHPENVPVLCETVQEFETMFGAQPFVFESAIAYPEGGSKTLTVYRNLISPGEMSVVNEPVLHNINVYRSTIKYSELITGSKVVVESDRGEISGSIYKIPVDADNVKPGEGYNCIGLVAFNVNNGESDVSSYFASADNEAGYIEGLSNLADSATNSNLCGMAWNDSETLFFVKNTSTTAIAKLTVNTIQEGTDETVSSGGFSKAASSISSMYKEDTPDLSYVYAKTLIKLGLPVIYENVAIRDNVFPLTKDVAIGPDDKVEYSTDGTRVVSINGVVQCSGKKEMSGLKMVNNLYNVLAGDNAGFSNLKDKGEYTVKYITSGGYPTFEFDTYSTTVNTDGEYEPSSYNAVAMKMINIAAERGDSVAIIDHTNKPERPLSAFNSNSVFNALIGGNDGDGNYKITASPEFGTMFTPWALYSGLPISWEIDGVSQNSAVLPASFGYLVALAKSIRTNANWLAIAGAARGQVPYINSLNTLERLSNTIADSYQSRDDVASLNAITNIKPYGLTIWGNRTLKDNAEKGNLTATSFLNLRNLVSDIKKTLYTTCKSLLFEQNNDVLWINFKMKVTPLLDQMQSGAGISGYKLIKGTTTEKAKLVATVKIYPIYAIEEFDVTVEISDQEVSVS
jgi:hypothetical protein